MNNPFKMMTVKEWILWICSLLIVSVSNILVPDADILTIFATLIGVTALIFASKGNVLAPFLTIFFSILYGIISFRFHYWGEMITYLGMTLPMSVWSAVTWVRNPSEENPTEVQIRTLNRRIILLLGISTVIVTAIFYFVLEYLKTPNLIFSTISITTSFMATFLTMLRSSYYAICYALNDIVLIILWTLASLKNPVYVPMIVNFGIFLFNDIYGFRCWKQRENRHSNSCAE